MKILGIETSCDETAAAVVTDKGEILSNLVLSQLEDHSNYGGVVPEIAARSHIEYLDSLILKAMNSAKVNFGDLDGVAATAGPGLIGGVLVGLVTGKAIAASAKIPLIGINHLEGHALSARLSENVPYPFLLLLVTGGHCQIVDVKNLGNYRIMGTTIDDAIGEAFDKVARLIGFEYPGGPSIERAALKGDPHRFNLPRPLIDRGGSNFSFSGLKTAVNRIVSNLKKEGVALCSSDINDISASFQSAVSDVLVSRLSNAINEFVELNNHSKHLVVAGGVAANNALQKDIKMLADKNGFKFYSPPKELCTDNAAMIAWAGMERLKSGFTSTLDLLGRARWPLDELKGDCE